MHTLRDGEKINNTYKIIHFLGKGSFAEVYQAEHILMHHSVAMKILIGDTQPDDIQRFMDEARVLAPIKHKHIIPIHECGVETSRGIPFLIVEYAPNGSLRDRHPKGTRVPLTTVLHYVIPIASALQYAHEQGIIHTDVKPENVLFGKQNNILLSDFGLAQLLPSTSSLSLQMMAGTPLYMAPEQITGHPKKASDQYSLAVIVYEWLNGTNPFEGKTVREICYNQRKKIPPPLYPHTLGVSHAFQEALFKALAKDPKDRYPSVQKFADTLVAIYKQEQQAATLPPTPLSQGQQGGTLLSVPLLQREQGAVPLAQLPQRQQVVAPSPAPLSDKPIISRRTLLVFLAATATIIGAGIVAGAMVEQHHLPLIASNPSHGVNVSTKPQPAASTLGSTPTETVSARPEAIPFNTYTKHKGAVKSLAWSPDGKYIASGSLDGTVHVWEVTKGKIEGRVYYGHTYQVRTVSWSPDGKYIASGDRGENGSNGQVNGVVHVWDAGTLQDVQFSPYTKHTSEVRCVAWSPLLNTGILLASCGDDGAIYVWNTLKTDQGDPLKPLPLDQEQILSIAWSQQTNPVQVAVSDGVGQLYLCNVTNTTTSPTLDRQSVTTASSGQNEQVWNVIWSPNDNRLAAVCNDGSLRIWTWNDAFNNFEPSDPIPIPRANEVDKSAAHSIAWSHDGKYIATGHDSGIVQIWKMDIMPHYLFAYTLHTKTVWWLAWSPDGTMLASAGEDTKVVVVTIQK